MAFKKTMFEVILLFSFEATSEISPTCDCGKKGKTRELRNVLISHQVIPIVVIRNDSKICRFFRFKFEIVNGRET